MKEFEIHNDLLKAAIWGGTGCYQMNGYVNADKDGLGRALIEYFACRLFSIHRIPGLEPNHDVLSILRRRERYGQLSEEKFEAAYTEFTELYHFTQQELKASGIGVDGKIKLIRSLRDFEIEEIFPKWQNNKDKIEFPANIITSYAHDAKPFLYGSWMSVVREVPIDLIVMYNDCLYHPPETCAYKSHGGENEVWVVEKSLFGYVELPRECFLIDDANIPPAYLTAGRFSICPEETHMKLATNLKHSMPLMLSEGLTCFPCESNRLIRYLIKREKKKNDEFLLCD